MTPKLLVSNFEFLHHNQFWSGGGGQWRSEGGAGGASAPGRRPEGGAIILQRNFLNLYTDKFVIIWKNTMKM